MPPCHPIAEIMFYDYAILRKINCMDEQKLLGYIATLEARVAVMAEFINSVCNKNNLATPDSHEIELEELEQYEKAKKKYGVSSEM